MARGNFYFDQNLYYIEVTKYYLPEEFAAKDLRWLIGFILLTFFHTMSPRMKHRSCQTEAK